MTERQGKKGPVFIMNMKVSDKTDSYLMKLVRFNEEEFAHLNKKLNVGSWYRVHGHMEMDEYLHQMVINARNIEIIPSKDVSVKDDSLIINLHIIVAYGVSISAVADNLISNVRYKVEEFTNMKVNKINVIVEGVRITE